MRIGCLQFAPQATEVSHNLNRADSVIAKASEHELDGLDVVIIPELGFCGKHYHAPADSLLKNNKPC